MPRRRKKSNVENAPYLHRIGVVKLRQDVNGREIRNRIPDVGERLDPPDGLLGTLAVELLPLITVMRKSDQGGLHRKWLMICAPFLLATNIGAAPLLHVLGSERSLGARTRSVATDGSNVVVALYSDFSEMIGRASWRSDSEMTVAYSSASSPSAPYVAYDGTNFLMAWLEGSGGSAQLRGQFPDKPAFVIRSNLPAIELRGLSWNGKTFLVVWASSSNGLSSIEGQILSSDGSVSGPLLSFNAPGANAEHCAVSAGTNHVIVWMESTEATNQWHTRSRTVSSESTLSEIVTLSSAPTFSPNPVTVNFGKDQAIAVWSREVGPYSNQNCCTNPCSWATNYWLMLFGRMIGPDGAPQGSEFQITSMHGKQTGPRAAFDGTNYLVAWTDTRLSVNGCGDYLDTRVYGQQVSAADGTLINPEFRAEPSVYSTLEALTFVAGQFTLISHNAYYPNSQREFVRSIGTFDFGTPFLCHFVPATNGYSQIDFVGVVPHGHYRLQISTNLSDWQWVPWDNWVPGFFVALRPNATTEWLDPFGSNSVPRFYRAVNPLDVCLSNLTLLDHIKSVWAFEKGRSAWERPGDAELFGPGKYLRDKPSCPLGAIYTVHEVGNRTECSLAVWGHTLE